MLICKSVVGGRVRAPKTGRSRVVALTAGTREALTAQRARVDTASDALVFPSITGGHRDSTTLYTFLRRCGREVGLDVRVGPQVLRYTANTLLRESGIADEIVRDRLGHATREMGHHYFRGHLDAQRAAAEGLAAQLERR